MLPALNLAAAEHSMRQRWFLGLLAGLLLLSGASCGDDAAAVGPDAGGGADAADVTGSVADADGLDSAAAPDVRDAAAPDLGGGDVAAGDSGAADAAPDLLEATDAPHGETADATPTVPRFFNFRAIAGVSMGGAAAMVAAQDFSRFDLVGSLGGYVDITYLHHLMITQILGGFCPTEQLLANLDDLNDPDQPGVFCGPVPTEHEWERSVDWNHFYFSINGGTVDRDFYIDAFTDFACVFGSMAGYNPLSPLMPPGMTREWLALPNDQKCANPLSVEYPLNLNREYNPDGEYPLVTFCDGQTPVGCTDEDPPRCGDQNPDYWDLMGWYDPAAPHTKPVLLLMAVDFNRNGRRDYGEPVVINLWERFEDVGADGCPAAREAGDGTCLAEAPADPPAAGADPNGDDYHPDTNPLGTERNWRREEGEPFDDFGLDGVLAPGAEDYGEGNDTWDAVPQRAIAEARDPRFRVLQAPLADLERIDWWVDGGRRDVLNSAVVSLHTMGALRARGQEVRRYEDFVGRPGTLFPDGDRQTYLLEMMDADLSAAAIGKNIHMVYGDPNATLEEIRLGDGGHVGDGDETAFRFMTFFTWVGERWPGLPLDEGGNAGPELNEVLTMHTAALDARYRFVVSLPPGYFDDEERRYPVLFFLHGLGQEPKTGIGFAAVLLQQFMKQGKIPRYIIVLPDGRCCFRDRETGLRECACEPSELSGHQSCIDPTCTGPHDTCAWRDIPSSRLDRECIQGSFYTNLQTDKWGGTEQLSVMRYGDALFELMDWVDANYRTRTPEWVDVPAP